MQRTAGISVGWGGPRKEESLMLDRFRLNIRHMLYIGKVICKWGLLPRAAVESPSLNVSNSKLGALKELCSSLTRS